MTIVNILFRISFVIFRDFYYLTIMYYRLLDNTSFHRDVPPERKPGIFAPLLISLGLCLATPAASEHAPEGLLRVSLTDGTEQVITREDLEGIAQTGFVSSSPWTDGIHHYEGVPLLALVKTLHEDARLVHVSARDDYKVTFSIDALTESWPILALKMDGQYISPRSKGPYWVIYPFDNHPELRREDIYARSIWQVEHLKIE